MEEIARQSQTTLRSVICILVSVCSMLTLLAVKCNPDPEVLRLLAKLGTGFDCASKAEIETVLDLGIDSSRIIYAQPCKTKSYTRFAKSNNVRQMTFDNADELHKIATIFPEAELFLRILTDDSTSTCRLSQKFGAALDATAGLFSLAKDLDLNVVGVAFHVGSGASDPYAFSKAVLDARSVFDQGLEYGFDLNTLDVGGGFCTETFDVMAADLAQALDDHFPSSVRIIGEPGRFYVSSAFTIAVNVIARRTIEQDKSYMLYINDGVYGNFSSIIFDHQQPVPRVLASDGVMQYPAQDVAPTEGKAIEYSIWGPTCDGLDCITSKWYSDRVLSVGDWLYFEDMGAYTKCSATRFNGFTDAHDTIYLCSEKGASELLAS